MSNIDNFGIEYFPSSIEERVAKFAKEKHIVKELLRIGKMNNMDNFGIEFFYSSIEAKAAKFAKEKHKSQLSDDNTPYFNHLIQVVRILREVDKEDENLLAAGWLHDVIEDCGVEYHTLIDLFGIDAASLVMEVTHDESIIERGDYYFPRLHSRRGIILKFADRLSNLNRIESWEKKRQAHYLKHSKFWRDRI